MPALAILSIAGCATKNSMAVDKVTPEVSRAETQAQELDKIFLLGDRALFEERKEKFLSDHPNSIYIQYIQLLSSKQFLVKNLTTEALALNLEVQNKTYNASKEIYYLALFESADIYEAQELYEKSLAALIESEKNKKFLQARKRLFELPLKLSVAYARLNLNKLSFNYLQMTQTGLNEYLKIEALDNSAQAKLYLEIGGGLTQWQSSDFDLELKKFILTYKFLVYSMNRNDSVFSVKAQVKLINQIQLLWGLIQKKSVQVDVDRIEEEKNQFLKMTEFSKLLNSIKMLEPLDGQKRTLGQEEFFGYINQLQDVVLEKIYAQYKYTPPTQESFRHQIFRDHLTIDAEPVETQF